MRLGSDWRSGIWALWHTISLSIAEEETDKKYHKKLFSLRVVMDVVHFPCEICRPHALKYLRENPLNPYIEDKDPYSMFRWVTDFHNFVNRRLGKPTYTLDEAIKHWKEECESCKLQEEGIVIKSL